MNLRRRFGSAAGTVPASGSATKPAEPPEPSGGDEQGVGDVALPIRQESRSLVRSRLVGLPRRVGRSQRMLLGLLVVPLLVGTTITALGSGGVDPSNAQVLTAEQLGSQYGIRFDLVAVTASGGLVDLRFTVLDQEKAVALFHTTDTAPALYLEQSGIVLRTKKGMSHHLSLVTGGRYFMLFSNAGGVVQAGTRVSVVVNDVRLAPVVAET